MTVLHWQMLLHYYVTSAPYAEHDTRHANSPAVSEYKAQLAEWDLIEWRDGIPCVTARGHALVKHIKSLPLPECRWFIPALQYVAPTPPLASNHRGST